MKSPAAKVYDFEECPQSQYTHFGKPLANAPNFVGKISKNSTATEYKSKISGRPRSEKSRLSILLATYGLLSSISVREVSIEAVAKHAGVGKTTIYRWWPNKVALVIDAVMMHLDLPPAAIEGNSAQDSVVRQLERFAKICRGRNGRMIAEIFAESQSSSEARAVFDEKFMAHHNEILASILSKYDGQSQKLNSAKNAEVVSNMIYGGLFFKLLSSDGELDQHFIDSWLLSALYLIQ